MGSLKESPLRNATRLFGNVFFLLILVAQLCHVVSDVRDASNSEPIRVLYIVTTLSEYNTGRKGTVRGSDRLKNLVLPVLREGVESMISSPHNYHVDVYMILGYKCKRIDFIRQQLPATVGLQIWQDATPVTYDMGRTDVRKRVQPLTRALSRQHRYVIKDKLMHYDFFVAFEDDMLIKGEHVHQYLEITNELKRLRREAPDKVSEHKGLNKQQVAQTFYGTLNKQQLARMIPGFMRVEVLLDGNNFGTNRIVDPVRVDLMFPAFPSRTAEKNETRLMVQKRVDPRPCCHVRASVSLPQSPKTDRLFIWETGIRALGVREMPESSFLSWVVLQRGNRNKFNSPDQVIGDFWSGRDGAFGKNYKRPFEADPQFLSNQGGWMATREQIWEWHTEHCEGGFLPPFNDPVFRMDGLFNKNVEYWSGGLQISQSSSCNLQRIVCLNPETFSRQIIYHTANNKQLQLKKKQGRFVTADSLLGQLNAVRKNAEDAKVKNQKAKSKFRIW